MSGHEDYRETWFIVPRSILDIQGITLSYLKVFETIFQFWNKGRKCFLSNPGIAERTGLKVSVIKEAIAFFEKNTELERIQIGMKRYLMQPVKTVEIPGLELVSKEVAANVATEFTQVAASVATCTEVTQVAANVAGGGRKRGQVVAANVATEVKNLNKEFKYKHPISQDIGIEDNSLKQTPRQEGTNPRAKGTNPRSKGFTLAQMMETNHFEIPENILVDWLEVRKTKRAVMTSTAWASTNSVLQKLRQSGLNPVECFESMVASGWQGIKVSYFEKEIAALKPKQPLKYAPKEDRAAEYEKIAARERVAEQRKKEEVEASKGFKNIVKEAREHVSLKERVRLYGLDQERIKNEAVKI